MQHEILLACAGYTGDIIVEKRKKDTSCKSTPYTCGYHISPNIDFLTVGEKETINKVVQLGWYMKEIENFVKLYRYENIQENMHDISNTNQQENEKDN